MKPVLVGHDGIQVLLAQMLRDIKPELLDIIDSFGGIHHEIMPIHMEDETPNRKKRHHPVDDWRTQRGRKSPKLQIKTRGK